MSAAGARIIGSREHKMFRSDRCGDERADFEVTGVGRREYCSYPDHTPRIRISWLYGRPRIWLKPWLPRSFWNA